MVTCSYAQGTAKDIDPYFYWSLSGL